MLILIMKIDFKKIINIKNKQDLKDFSIDKPIFQLNYLFHYLILLNNLDGLKLIKYPVYIENNDGLNAFHLAAKEDNIPILTYLIKTYPEYIYNRTSQKETFAQYLPFENFSILINKFPKLNWEDLIEESSSKSCRLFKSIITNLSFNELQKFIKSYNIKPKQTNAYLFGVIRNYILKVEEKITILNEFSDEDINIKNELGEGLILATLDLDDKLLFDYLLDRNIDVDYYTFIKSDNPLRIAIYFDILNNEFNYSKKIIKKIIDNNRHFYNEINKYIDNLAHTVIYNRITYNNINKQNISSVNKVKIPVNKVKIPVNKIENPVNKLENSVNKMADIEILKLCDNKTWNQVNIDKISPLELLIDLDYDIYSKIIQNNKISINIDILSKLLLKPKNENNNYDKWIKLYQTLPNYIQEPDSIIMDSNIYSHYTIFQAKFKDVCIFIIYLQDTYQELLIPNMKSYLINNITFDNTFPFSDDIISKEPVFPWIISYYSETEYYIHPYLNNLINAERTDNKRYAVVFLSLIYDNIMHANILVYDFKNMTVERFEPYGNTNLIDNTLDDILEEELTWNTGLKYLRPNDFLPYAGFQTISDENNLINKKAGDFGGFCLAWCLWYLETKIKNPDVDSKILVNKLINKITKLEIKFIEYIRNYSTKINDYRITYLKKIGIDEKDISNIHLTGNNDEIITDYLLNAFN